MEHKWTAIEFPNAEKIQSDIYEAIKFFDKEGFSYEEIYTALHKVIDLQLYKFEVDKILD